MKNIVTERRLKVSSRCLTPVSIAIIGKAIRDGASYLPIRNLSASLAAPAPRKNYAAQLKNIWDYFLSRWRYVKDIYGTETITTSPRAVYNLVMGHNGGAGGKGYGVGDCDDATVAIGSMMMSVGFPVRIATTASPGMPGVAFSHVFAQVYLPPHGWITVDPVLVPHGGLGNVAPNSRMAVWDLKGKLLATRGVSASAVKTAFKMQRSKSNVGNKKQFSDSQIRTARIRKG